MGISTKEQDYLDQVHQIEGSDYPADEPPPGRLARWLDNIGEGLRRIGEGILNAVLFVISVGATLRLAYDLRHSLKFYDPEPEDPADVRPEEDGMIEDDEEAGLEPGVSRWTKKEAITLVLIMVVVGALIIAYPSVPFQAR